MKPKKICIEVSTEVADYIAEEGFKYTPYLGAACIKQVSLYIEDTKVETLTGEFLFAYHKLH